MFQPANSDDFPFVPRHGRGGSGSGPQPKSVHAATEHPAQQGYWGSASVSATRLQCYVSKQVRAVSWPALVFGTDSVGQGAAAGKGFRFIAVGASFPGKDLNFRHQVRVRRLVEMLS